jgi:DNA polymerase-1
MGEAWPDDIAPRHRTLLTDAGILPEVARGIVRTIDSFEEMPPAFYNLGEEAAPGLLFLWTGLRDEILPQYRPDVPLPDGSKYRFPGTSTPVLWVHSAMRKAVAQGTTPIVLVEGTKQHLAAVSALAGTDHAVVGMSGCYGWSHDGGKPIPDFLDLPWDGRVVYVCLDADVSTNRDVWHAAEKLQAQLTVRGCTVRHVVIPGGSTTGLDDVLGAVPDPVAVMARLLERATSDLPKRPKAPRGAFMGDSGVLVEKLADAVREVAPTALAADGTIATYEAGVYQVAKAAFSGHVGRLLGDEYRPAHRAAAEEFEVGRLHLDGRYLPERADAPVLNLRNGLLNLRTGELAPHSPDHLSFVQIPMEWDPDASCPTVEAWAADVIPDQWEDLLEVTSTMLDPSSTPPKAAFLFGPSRSGKSTFIRLARAIVGPKMVSAVTLQQLATDRFASANVYGKMLNAAADVPAHHIDDVSTFKMLTGEDLVSANRKYGNQFAFVNTALFMFSGNELPTVSEASRAYLERVKPFAFDRSFAGNEDPRIERKMMAELPGLLAALVAAWRRLTDRGHYAVTAPGVARDFETSSNRVRLWVEDECQIHRWRVDGRSGEVVAVSPGAVLPPSQATTPADLRRQFARWSAENGTGDMGLKLFKSHLTSVDGVLDVRLSPSKSRAYNVTVGHGEEVTPPEKVAKVAGNTPPLPDVGHSEDLNDVQKGSESELGKGGGIPATFATVATLGPPPKASAQFATGVPLVVDLETQDSAVLWSHGPGFVRIAGWSLGWEGFSSSTDPEEVAALVEDADLVVGHNLMGFDLVALARYHGVDIHRLTRQGRVVDTMLVASLADPPPARMGSGQVQRHYKLDALGKRYGLGAKTADLKDLAKLHGGFGAIPTDDPTFLEYLRGDVGLTRRLYSVLDSHLDAYALREHRVAAIAAQISLNGFRVDVPLLRDRIAAGEALRARQIALLVDRYGLPLTNKAGKPAKAPQNTEGGREAIFRAFVDAGLPPEEMPTTDTGAWATGKDAMAALVEAHQENDVIVDIGEAVLALNGIRTVFQTISDNLVGDRVHPTVDMRQASGRWSITKPGLTVMGKRAGKWREREVYLPEDGHVIVSADLSQIDARAIAAHSQDEAYLAMFAPGRDLHAEVAERVFGDRSRREDAKAIGHGWNYGQGPKGCSATAGVELAVAEEFDRAMADQFPDLVAWRDQVREEAEGGALLDNGFGRKMRPDPRRGYTQGPALMGQGTARDLMMEGLLRLPTEVLPMLRGVVHDEVVLSIPEDIVDDVERAVLEALTFEWAPPGKARTVLVEAGLGKRRGRNWGHVYDPED